VPRPDHQPRRRQEDPGAAASVGVGYREVRGRVDDGAAHGEIPDPLDHGRLERLGLEVGDEDLGGVEVWSMRIAGRWTLACGWTAWRSPPR
jgi:hypothetical protein